MDHRMRITAEAAARLLLRYFQEERPQWSDEQTPLDEIVSWLGLHVATFYPEDYQEGTYGFVDPDEDENLIWLRRDLPETLRRFTLAHELGHVVLHSQRNERVRDLLSELHLPPAGAGMAEDVPAPSRDDPCQEDDVEQQAAGLLDQEQFQEALGIGESYDPRSQRELAANIFAAELLMPIDRVRNLYLVRRVAPGKLAGIFAVSQAALLNRLAGLLMEPAPSVSTPEVPVAKPARKRYDEFQQAAIEAPTPALIVAGPGSGKTSTLIGRVEYLVHTLGVQPEHILALTFSRKAAREMEERLSLALGGTDQLPKVSTFHAFCADLLRQHAALAGLRPDFSLIDEAEGYFLLRQLADEMQLRHYQKLQAPAYYFPDILKAISRAKDELIDPDEYARLARRMQEQAQDEEAMQRAEKALEVARVYALYEQELQRRGDSDFGGLLVLAIRLLREHPEILREQQEKYQHILVDEFQDVNRASGVLLRELAGARQRVWVVGDANQAIYSFRGASPANITSFTSDFPGARVLPLARNYRSRPDLVTLAETFRCALLEAEQKPGKNQPVRPIETGAYVTLAKAADEASEMTGLIQDIRHKHAGGYAYRDMVVLCRTRAHAKKITRMLAAAELPVIERGGMLEQEHVKDALSIILLLANPGGMGLLRAARQPEHPLSQCDIEAVLLAAREQKTSPGALLLDGEAPLAMSVPGRHAFNRLSEIVQALLSAPDIWSLLAQYLLVETSLVRDLLCEGQSKQAAAMRADYDALLHLARHYDQQQLRLRQREQQDEPGPVERAKGFLEYLSLLVLLRQDGNSRQGAEDSAEAEADIIRVMTVHASKGLEFPVVYLPGLVQRRFPSQARSSPVEPPEGMLAPESVGSAAHESGEACLFYVGVTRARDHLVLSYSERYGKLKYKRSPYLDALEAGLPPERLTLLHWDAQTVGAPPEIEQRIAQSSQPSEKFIAAMKPVTLSAAAIESYHRCPRQYLYGTIYRFESDADAYQLFWQATQRTLEALRGRVGQGKTPAAGEQPPALPTQQEVQELYSQHWLELGGQSLPFAAMYEEHGRAVAEALRRKLTTEGDVNWDVRSSYNVDVAGKTVHVTIDRVETSAQVGEPVKFVRARFGRRKDKPPAELRELFYTLVYRQLHPGLPVELHSHNLSTGEVLPIKLTARKEQSLYDEIEQSIDGLERNHYPPQPAEPFRCPACPFFMICPA
jgi:DNA helicase-2/ATP-dependent DNA helicase PcrA